MSGFPVFGEPFARRFGAAFGVLRGGGSGVTYSLRDDFTTALSAGSVNGTNSEPGPGVRNVTDVSGSGVSIVGGKLHLVGDGTFNHEGFWLTPALTRAAGLVVRLDFSGMGATISSQIGITSAQDANFSGYNNKGISLNGSGVHDARRSSGASSPHMNADAVTSGAFYMVLRAVGRYILFDPQTGADVQLWWWDDWDNTAALYIGATNFTNLAACDFDNARSPLSQYFNIGALCLASDSFNRADGVLGSTDGAGHTEANGGSGKAWTERLGTWGIATNKAAASALSGGAASATVDAGTKDVVIECDVTRSAGNAGIISWTDANNYILAYHDGTNAILSTTVAGITNTRITAAATYVAGASLRVRRNGARILLYYNDLYVGTYATVNAALTGTQHGLYTTDTGNTLDNFICFGQFGYNTLREI